MKHAHKIRTQPQITRNELDRLMALRDTKEALKRRLDLIEAEAERLEDVIISAVDGGALTPEGFELTVRETARRYPPWKEHFVEVAGQARADQVLAATTPTVTRAVLVRKAA